MKIGIMGTRGIPNFYGGFEQFASQLSQQLKDRGHSVWVYNSSDHPYKQSFWQGVNIIHCRDWESKAGTIGQFIYDLNCIRDARKRNFDILLHLGYTSDSIWGRLWPRKTMHIVNMDGMEWRRSKYGKLVKVFLKKAESLAAHYATALVADSEAMKEYLDQHYAKQSTFIPYGASIPGKEDSKILYPLNLEAGNYVLSITRMEPENNIEMLIKGWLNSSRELFLVLIGNTNNRYGKYLKKKYEQPGIRFMGALYDKRVLDCLRQHCALYFHGHSVGGTNPSLLEAMACECNIAAHDNEFNRSVLLGNAHYYLNEKDIAALVQNDLFLKTNQLAKQHNLERIKTIYDPERIAEDYMKLFIKLAHKNEA